MGNEEEATAAFQRIQEANSVLSDAKERSWYDSHRDEILRGEDFGDSDDDSDDGGLGGGRHRHGRRSSSYVVNVWPYFSSSAYSGYGDDPQGYYAVYRGVFEKVDERERDGGMPGVGGKDGPAPGFGSPESPWSEVSAFYAYWGDFVSRLSFGWADQYREQDAPSRQVRRAMEKENKKGRDAARKKYQDAVRALVDFAKKRDKRVMQRQVEAQREEAAKALADAKGAKAKAEEFRKERERWLKEQTEQWEATEAERRQKEEAGGTVAFRLADEEGSSSSSSGASSSEEGRGGKGSRRWTGRKGKKNKGSRSGGVVFECAVCNKTFKSEKQLSNHKQSRAHRKAVEELQAEFGDLEGLEESEAEEGEEEEEEEEEAVVVDADVQVVRDGREDEVLAAAGVEDEVPAVPTDRDGDAEVEKEEGGDESSSSEEEDEVGHVARQVNRFAFADSSSSDEDDDEG